jgi:hypothetical protein
VTVQAPIEAGAKNRSKLPAVATGDSNPPSLNPVAAWAGVATTTERPPSTPIATAPTISFRIMFRR